MTATPEQTASLGTAHRLTQAKGVISSPAESNIFGRLDRRAALSLEGQQMTLVQRLGPHQRLGRVR